MIVPLFIFLIICLGGISLYLSRSSKNTQTSENFFLLDRKLGLFGLIMSLLATQIGGGALLGSSEEAYLRGWSVLFYPLGMVLGLIVLGLGYGAKMRRLNLTTIPEIFEVVYKSSSLRQVASLLSIVAIFFILVGQGIAARKFFASLGFNGDALFLFFWCILIAYTAKGGLAAAVKTDILQATFIIVTLFIALFVSAKTAHPSPTLLLAKSESTTPWMTWLLLPLLFMLIEQDMGQWCFAAKNPRTVSIAALIAAFVFMGVACVPIFFGVNALNQGLVVEKGASVLIASVGALTNPLMSTFVTCAVLMAIISTANSLLCSVSSNIVCDFPQLKKSVKVSQVITLGVGAFTLMLAFVFENVVAILMFSYELAVCVLFVPITMAIWTKQPQKSSASISMLIGAACFVTTKIISIGVPTELMSLGCSFTGFFLNEWLYKKKKFRILEK